MKYCQKCGKEIMDEAVVCPNCGCAATPVAKLQTENPDNKPDAKVWLICGICVLAISIILALFVNAWVGVFGVLAAELVFAVSRNKIQKYIKSGNPSIDKNELKKAVKEFEASDSTAKICHIFAIISFVVLIVFVIIV